MSKLLRFTHSIAGHVGAILDICRAKLSVGSGLINGRRIHNAFLDTVPKARVERSLFPLIRQRIPIAKCIHVALILTGISLGAQELTDKELQGIRRVCKIEPHLQPLVEPPYGVVACKDLELWMQLKKMGRTNDAMKLITQTKGPNNE